MRDNTVRDTVRDTVRGTVSDTVSDTVKNAKHHRSPTLNYTLLVLSWLDKSSNEIMDCTSFYFGTFK